MAFPTGPERVEDAKILDEIRLYVLWQCRNASWSFEDMAAAVEIAPGDVGIRLARIPVRFDSGLVAGPRRDREEELVEMASPPLYWAWARAYEEKVGEDPVVLAVQSDEYGRAISDPSIVRRFTEFIEQTECADRMRLVHRATRTQGAHAAVEVYKLYCAALAGPDSLRDCLPLLLGLAPDEVRQEVFATLGSYRDEL